MSLGATVPCHHIVSQHLGLTPKQVMSQLMPQLRVHCTSRRFPDAPPLHPYTPPPPQARSRFCFLPALQTWAVGFI